MIIILTPAVAAKHSGLDNSKLKIIFINESMCEG